MAPLEADHSAETELAQIPLPGTLLGTTDAGSELDEAPEGLPPTLDEPEPDPSHARSIFLANLKAAYRAERQERREPVPREDAKRAMMQVNFFKEFEVVIPGVLDELAKVALSQINLEGEVLFRQGDPAVDCYVVLSGKVGVFVRSSQQESPRDLDPKEKLEMADGCCRCPCFRKKKYEEYKWVIQDRNRQYVKECNNTYTPHSNLGTQVDTLGKGNGFGELGLLDKKPRAASIKCLERCELLVLLKDDFIRLLGDCIDEKSFRKQLYFQHNVPGFEESTNKMKKIKKQARNFQRTSHATDSFREWQESCGHILLSEGSVADPMIVVILSGHVDFVRRFESPAMGNTVMARKREILYTRLFPGQLFCSVGVFGLLASEPFTARISSETCRYFIAKGADVGMLPERNLSTLCEHIRISMRPLLCYSSAFVSMDHLEPEAHERLRPPFAPEPLLQRPVKYSLNPAAPIEQRPVTFRPPQVAWGPGALRVRK